LSEYQLITDEGKVIKLQNCKARMIPTVDGKYFIQLRAEINTEDKPILENNYKFSFISPGLSALTVKPQNFIFTRLYRNYIIHGFLC
jgi:hypothetical protein